MTLGPKWPRYHLPPWLQSSWQRLSLSSASVHPPAPSLRHTGIQGIQIETDETVSFTGLPWRQMTLSQKCMKISKAPETTNLVISSTQVCLTFCLALIYCRMSWTTKALLCCQTWKPYIRESQSFSKIILWEAEGLWNNSSFEIFPIVKKKNKFNE